MARRAIYGIKEKIMLQTVEQCYDGGLADLSTKRVASACGVTDTTIFNYFMTKSGWLKSTFEYVYGEALSRSATFCNCKQAWDSVFDFFIRNPSFATYYMQYVSLNEMCASCIECFDKIPAVFAEHLPARTMRFCWLHICNSTVRYALYIAQGLLPDSEQMRKNIFDAVVSYPVTQISDQ